jgi:signal transduction histidine kinase
MPAGGTLTISTRRIPAKPDAGLRKASSTSNKEKGLGAERVEISFKDTGEGIRKEDLPKIFYPFFTTKSTGSGLGLSIVQRVIEEHFGIITVQSSREGTEFFINLPLDEGGAPLHSATFHMTEAVSRAEKRALPHYSSMVK